MNTRKKLIITVLGLAGLFVLSTSFTRPESTLEYATMRTVESSLGGQSSIILAYEGKIEELELDKGSVGNMAGNTQKINQAIRLLASKGFELVSQSGGDYISMYSFVRK
jgi:hypothetical protein